MVKVLEEGADLSGYEVLKCTADGALHGSRMVELERVKYGEQILLAVEVADSPPKPLEQAQEEDFWALRRLVEEICEESEPCSPNCVLQECQIVRWS